mgnify:CR=1 FL=1
MRANRGGLLRALVRAMEDKVRENSDIVAAARQARPMLQPFLS